MQTALSNTNIRSVRDSYIAFYDMFQGCPTPAQVRFLFGLKSDDPTAPFYIVFKRVISRYIKSKEKKRVASQRARVRRMTAIADTDDGSINAESVIDLLRRQSFRCAICNTYLTYDKNRHLDHIRPLSGGGSHIIVNVQWLCRSCNLRKGAKVNG